MHLHNDFRSTTPPVTKSAALLAAEAAFASPPPARTDSPAPGAGPVVKVVGRKLALTKPSPTGASAKPSVAAPDWSQVVAARYGVDQAQAQPNKAAKRPRVFLLPSAAAKATAAAKPKAAAATAEALRPKPSETLSAAVQAGPVSRKRRARVKPAPVHVIFSAPASEPLVLSAQQTAQLQQALAALDTLFAEIRAAAAFRLEVVESAATASLWGQLSARVREQHVELAAYKVRAPRAEDKQREAALTPLQRLFL
jgi:hypothetical protein